MITEQDIRPVNLLSRVGPQVDFAQDIIAARLGAPGLEILTAEIGQEGNVGQYCQKKGYLQSGQPDRLRLSLFEQGVKLAYGNPSDKNLAIAREAIQASLAEPTSAGDPHETHFPFLRKTKVFRNADLEHLMDTRQPIEIELLNQILPHTDAQTATLVLEDIIGFEQQVQIDENLNGFSGNAVALRREAITNVLSNITRIILGNPREENIKAWAACFSDEAERLFQTGEQDEFLSLLAGQIASIYDLGGGPDVVGVALARNLVALFRLNHPAGLDRQFLQFARFLT